MILIFLKRSPRSGSQSVAPAGSRPCRDKMKLAAVAEYYIRHLIAYHWRPCALPNTLRLWLGPARRWAPCSRSQRRTTLPKHMEAVCMLETVGASCEYEATGLSTVNAESPT